MTNAEKIAFAGGMAAGKTSVATAIAERYSDSQILSFASPVKEIALNIFGMKQKNRRLLQDIGTAYRRRDRDIWVNVLLSRIDEGKEVVIVDDVRYENELIALKSKGFKIIWLETSQKERIRRLKEKYGVECDEHIIGLRHSSERHDQIRVLADEVYNTDQMSSTSIAVSVCSSLAGARSSWSSGISVAS